jgi:hypothetical protein
MDRETFVKELVDVYGYGICDKCNKILPIERGDNFEYQEGINGRWLCMECVDKQIRGE